MGWGPADRDSLDTDMGSLETLPPSDSDYQCCAERQHLFTFLLETRKKAFKCIYCLMIDKITIKA